MSSSIFLLVVGLCILFFCCHRLCHKTTHPLPKDDKLTEPTLLILKDEDNLGIVSEYGDSLDGK